ncbi:hypothetical protein CFter6_2842 [Collimonas fungivorans]|uniref:Uncharacterized protein n=1 Tax=Collimonas fungivorans TaxID=158899 RepID=A0A127PCI6_9BURK|nr:hypothetical protein CFter6_2842 [Collimonas fungivorans]
MLRGLMPKLFSSSGKVSIFGKEMIDFASCFVTGGRISHL